MQDLLDDDVTADPAPSVRPVRGTPIPAEGQLSGIDRGFGS